MNWHPSACMKEDEPFVLLRLAVRKLKRDMSYMKALLCLRPNVQPSGWTSRICLTCKYTFSVYEDHPEQ